MTIGRIRLLICTVFMLISVILSAQQSGNIAYQDGQVRFTVITDGVIRLEWEPEGKFTDLASFVASECNYPEVAYKVRTSGKKVKIQTEKMTLEYKTGTGRFEASNLVIKANDGFFTWKPGMKQQANLKGTFRTLDGLDGDVQTQNWVADMKKGEIRQFEDGLLAKDGWTLFRSVKQLRVVLFRRLIVRRRKVDIAALAQIVAVAVLTDQAGSVQFKGGLTARTAQNRHPRRKTLRQNSRFHNTLPKSQRYIVCFDAYRAVPCMCGAERMNQP